MLLRLALGGLLISSSATAAPKAFNDRTIQAFQSAKSLAEYVATIRDQLPYMQQSELKDAVGDSASADLPKLEVLSPAKIRFRLGSLTANLEIVDRLKDEYRLNGHRVNFDRTESASVWAERTDAILRKDLRTSKSSRMNWIGAASGSRALAKVASAPSSPELSAGLAKRREAEAILGLQDQRVAQAYKSINRSITSLVMGDNAAEFCAAVSDFAASCRVNVKNVADGADARRLVMFATALERDWLPSLREMRDKKRCHSYYKAAVPPVPTEGPKSPANKVIACLDSLKIDARKNAGSVSGKYPGDSAVLSLLSEYDRVVSVREAKFPASSGEK